MKKPLIFLSVALVLVAVGIGAYLLLFAKPGANVSEIEVKLLPELYQGDRACSDEEMISSISGLMTDARAGLYADMQAFWSHEELPSEVATDYALVTFSVEITNTTVFDSFCNGVLVDRYDETSELFLVTNPSPTITELERFSKESVAEYSVYVYLGDKTKEEIEATLKSVGLQIPFHNRIYAGGNQYADCDKATVSFVGF